MSEPTKPTTLPPLTPEGGPATEADRLLARYGADLGEDNADDETKKELLLTLWRIMHAFVDLGFSVRSGEKLAPNDSIGMDDVLEYLILEDTAPETVAPAFNDKNKEQ